MMSSNLQALINLLPPFLGPLFLPCHYDLYDLSLIVSCYQVFVCQPEIINLIRKWVQLLCSISVDVSYLGAFCSVQ